MICPSWSASSTLPWYRATCYPHDGMSPSVDCASLLRNRPAGGRGGVKYRALISSWPKYLFGAMHIPPLDIAIYAYRAEKNGIKVNIFPVDSWSFSVLPYYFTYVSITQCFNFWTVVLCLIRLQPCCCCFWKLLSLQLCTWQLDTRLCFIGESRRNILRKTKRNHIVETYC